MPRKKVPAQKAVTAVPGEITHIVFDFSDAAKQILPLEQWTRGPAIPVYGEVVPAKNGKRRPKGRKKKT